MAYDVEEAKKLVVEAGKKLLETGLIARTWGNVSARISDTQFVITPSGRAYDTLTPEEVVVVNIDDCSHEGDIKPSSEKGIHADAYKHHPLVNFVIHTHQKAATIVSITGMEIRNVYNEFKPVLGDYVPVADYAMSTTNPLRKNVEKCMMMNPSCRAFMLMHHGTLCLGDSFDQAFEVADTLEKCCEKVIKDNYLRHSWEKTYSVDNKLNYFLEKEDAGKMPEAKPCFSSVFGNKLTQLAETNHNIVAITAAMCAGTGLTGFSERFPDRFFDVGIAEEHAVSMAAGMAKQGLLPVVAIYSGFLQRAYDMLIHDVSLQDLHVVFCVDRAGLVGNDGETHHGAFDISYLRSVPHMQVLCPANFAELEAMLDEAVNRMSGPVAIRYPRGGGGRYTDCHTEGCTHLRSGNDITIAAYGTDINIALNTADILADKGIHADVYKLSRLNSGYYADIIDSMRETGRFLMSEQVCQTGCIADEILAYAERAGVKIECAYTPNLGSGIVVQGTVPELIRHCGLDENSLAKAAEKLVRGE